MTFAVIWPIKSFDGSDQKSSPYFRTLVLSHMVHIVSIVRIPAKIPGEGRGRAAHLVGLAIPPVGQHANQRCLRRPCGFLGAVDVLLCNGTRNLRVLSLRTFSQRALPQ